MRPTRVTARAPTSVVLADLLGHQALEQVTLGWLLDGLGDRPGPGRKPRLSEAERSVVLALAATDPPGRLVRRADGELAARDDGAEAHWTLSALAAAARARGIRIGRSQVRRIFLAEGVRWRQPRSWATSADPDFAPKGPRSSRSTRPRPRARRSSTWTSSGR